MLNLISSLIIASLLIGPGFNFFGAAGGNSIFVNQFDSNSPQLISDNSLGIKTTAQEILLVDDNSGVSLYAKNLEATRSIASITKLMTALVFLSHNPGWDQVVEIKASDRREGGQIYLLTGETVTVKDLFNLMLVASSNEAAIALARSATSQDFVAEMNRQAAELGMLNSYFADPSGLAPGNVSRGADLIKLANAAFANQDIQSALQSVAYQFTTSNTRRAVKVENTDRLLLSFLNDEAFEILGAKTGYLDEAGYCLLIKVKTPLDQSLTLVLLGAATIEDRWQETKGLIDWVLRHYRWPVPQPIES
ncbi:MAG: serine hydrolase [Patescibacteria group bacterium]|jgi:D-alanyl-D-alanine endopeptidase (penicillin-binding protein 7)|nr:serine hydrolase [Patescibacteria group bacterium]